MDGEKVDLTDMLICRERRAALQEEMIGKYHCPVISFCMNIPGPVKTNEKILRGFLCGKEALLEVLKQKHAPIPYTKEFHEKTGDELLLSVEMPASRLKKLTTEIEESHPLGRLFDMDVIDTDGSKLSRPVFRKCLICGEQAQICARTRRHSLEEMSARVEEMLSKL